MLENTVKTSEILGNISRSSKAHIIVNNTCKDRLKVMLLMGKPHEVSCLVWGGTCRTCELQGSVKYIHSSLTLRV